MGFLIVVFGFVYMYERGKYLKHHRPLANKLLLLIGLVCVITIFSIPFYLGMRIIGAHGFLLFMGAGIYYAIKKLDTPYILMIRFFVSVSLVLGVNAYTISEALVNVFIILFVLAVGVVLVIGVIWFTNRQYNALFRFSYQSLFLVLFTLFSHQLIYALMITLPALFLFELIVVEKVKRLSQQKV